LTCSDESFGRMMYIFLDNYFVVVNQKPLTQTDIKEKEGRTRWKYFYKLTNDEMTKNVDFVLY
jgi:hypothetical protein